jgi:hypothetical protein
MISCKGTSRFLEGRAVKMALLATKCEITWMNC